MATASTDDAGLLVEGNCFEDVKAPTCTKYGDSKQPGRLDELQNVFVRSGKPEAAGKVADVSHKYKLDNAEEVAATVRDGAGVAKIAP